MNTIFDHAATLADLADLWGDDFASQDDCLAYLEGDEQVALADVVRLARLRGDATLLAATLPQIQGEDLHRQLTFTPCLVAGRALATA
jgi:hypothetical protein